jgi:hypothetical protein
MAATHVAAFGTIGLGDQEFEHERITRNALACAEGTTAVPPYDCFEPKSMDMLAGTKDITGAVGAPDANEIFDSKAHCDNADFLDLQALGLNGTYFQTRQKATETLFECVNHLRGRIGEGVDAAGGIVNNAGVAVADETNIDLLPCNYLGGEERAKCNALEGFGRAIHGVQDFFAHSNWVDSADPSQAVSATNPPGLERDDRPPFLELTGAEPNASSVPQGLSTGCFISSVLDPFGGARDCEKDGRVTHEVLNKDNGDINVKPGIEVTSGGDANITSDPRTGRGKIGRNFERAVEEAIAETRRQWEDFRDALKEKYGEEKGQVIIKAMVTDKGGDGQADANIAGRNFGWSSLTWVAATFSLLALV